MSRWLVLDLDGTLVDSVPDLSASLNRTLARAGLAAASEEEVTTLVGDGAKALVERAFAARGQTPEPEVVAAMIADYTAHAAEASRPYPGVLETLALLRDQGWTMAVCTNKPVRAAHVVLRSLDLAPFFATIGGGDSFSARKPDPAHLLETLAACDGDPARTVMVGDHHNDIEAARGAGTHSVWARWGYGRDVTGASATAAAFADLPGLVGALVPVPSPSQPS